MSIWLRDMATILRKANVPVIEESYTRGPYSGKKWSQVGFRGQGLGSFRFIIWHHDASPQGDSPGALDWCKYMEIAPAGAVWVCSGCNGKHASGTWHVIAAGLSNHAGTGGNDPRKGGNTWGVPIDGMNAAALMLAYKIKPRPGLIRHLDWTNGLIDGNGRFTTYGRKNDIDGLDLTDERARVQAIMRELAKANESPKVAGLRRRLTRTRAKVGELKESGESTAGYPTYMSRLRDRISKLTKG